MPQSTAEPRHITSLTSVDASEWNALNPEHSPFLRHEFLVALERHGAVGERFGWLPRFIVRYDNDNKLLGAMPLYEKNNSYGELVFDHGWADAYYRHNIPYFPKLVAAIPYTPATGSRLLTTNNDKTVQEQLIQDALVYCQQQRFSSLHCLFPTTAQLELLQQAGLLVRSDIQFQWFNDDYTDFDNFLAALRSSKRKKIRQERKRVQHKDLKITIRHGNELSAAEWADVHRFYVMTFQRKGGYATLSQSFFEEIGHSMGEQIVIVFATLGHKNIAAAINFRSERVLYGRHWGCDVGIDSLHFELCYYQGIEYAIKHGLERFEPGAQGEYKMSRGFNPVITHSAHWLENEMFRTAISDFVCRENAAIRDYQKTLLASSAYKTGHAIFSQYTAGGDG